MTNIDLFIELNRKFLVDGWQSITGNVGGGYGIAKYLTIDIFKEPLGSFNSLCDRILIASEHLQGYDSPAELIDRLKSEGMDLLDILEMIEKN